MIRINPYQNNLIKQQNPSFKGKPSTLNILYYNDTHGNLDSMARLVDKCATFKKNVPKDQAKFILSGGDNYSGGDVAKNKTVVDVMGNAMDVDISAIGNHELDASAKGFMDATKKSKVKFVASNIECDKSNPMKDKIPSSIVEQQNGEKYGFVGAMPIDFASCSKKSAQAGIEVMDFDDTVEAIQEEVDKLTEKGVDKIILMSHVGHENDKKLARSLQNVDIIIGGHSHTVVQGTKEGENLLQSKSGEPIIITQAGENGNYCGNLIVDFDQKGIITKVNNKLTPSDSEGMSPNLKYIGEVALGKSPVAGYVNKVDKMPKNRRNTPHGWANFVVDSMQEELKTDVALLNAANIRKVPRKGEITERTIRESAPMKNKLIRTKITQKQLVDAIQEASIQTLNNPNGEPGFLFTAGITYKVDKKGNLLEMNFVDRKGNKTPIDFKNPSDNITYTAAYDDFTMRSDGEYPKLAPKFEVEYFDFDKDQTAINVMKRTKGGVDITDDKRLEIVGTLPKMQLSSSMQNFLNLTCPKGA